MTICKKSITVVTLLFLIFLMTGLCHAKDQNRYCYIFQGIIFNPTIVKTDSLFTKLMAKNLKKENNRILTTLEKKYKKWPICESDAWLENTINFAIVVNRADVNEEINKISKNNLVSFNHFNIGLSLVFYKLTDQGDSKGVTLYYNRFIQGTKTYKLSFKMKQGTAAKYFSETFREVCQEAVQKAYDEYRPEKLTGRVTTAQGEIGKIDLGYKNGLHNSDIVTVNTGQEELEYSVSDIKPGTCTIEPVFDGAKLKKGDKIVAQLNAKRMSDSRETFRIGKVKIKSACDDLKKYSAFAGQIFHDFISASKGINMLPPSITMSEDTQEMLKAHLNIPASTIFTEPKPDYLVNIAILKCVHKNLKKSAIANFEGFLSFTAAGVRDNQRPEKKLLFTSRDDFCLSKKIIAREKINQEIVALDSVLYSLHSLSKKISSQIHKKIKLNYD